MSSRNSWLNVIFRRLDYWVNQTGRGGLQRFLKVPGYPPAAILLLCPVVVFLIFGPTLGWRGWYLVALTPVICVCVLLAARRLAAGRKAQWVATAAVIATAGVVWILAGPTGREADSGPYRHILLPALVALMVLAQVVPPLLARFLVAHYRKRYFPAGTNPLGESLRHAELFVRPSVPSVGAGRFLTSVLPTFFQHFLTLLFFPSVVALLVPHPWMWYSFLGTFFATWVIYSLGGVDPRLNAMLDLTKRAFFLGAQMIVSLLVIVLALGRLFEFSYIAILLNSASVGVVIFYFTAAYTTLWLYEAWLNFILCERLLPLFLDEATAPATTSSIPYEFVPGVDATNVSPDNRSLQIHGSRFVVVGHFLSTSDPGHPVECFETYEKADLFEAVVRRSHPKVDVDSLERQFGVADLRQRILTYFAILNVLLLLGCWGAWALASSSEQVAEYDQPVETADSTFDLREKLFPARGGDKAENPVEQRPVILVVASGGGTRAAIYAASVFQGLGELGALPDVALMSGVSGGSAAIAYLTVHRNELVDKQVPAAWKRYADVLAEPFIEDVLRGAAELRIVYGYGLGNLLDESFQRRMAIDRTVSAAALGRSDVGLIFNSTLAGSSNLDQTGHWGPRSPKGAGGRVVFTNVGSDSAFPSEGYDAFTKDEYLNYNRIRDKEALLSTTAALSANFPPVFSNALVATSKARYWVTDGGASENRGGVSALYVLRDALRRESSARPAKATGSLRSPPKIHIVIAEASAFSMDYSEDRGVGSTLGASEKYASQLMVELMRNIKQEYVGLGGSEKNLYLHYLPMPLVFRARGGVGTHWMLGSYVTLTESGPNLRTADTVTLSGALVKELIMDLHRSTSSRVASGSSDQEKKNTEKVRKWIEKDPHHDAWTRVVETLRKQ